MSNPGNQQWEPVWGAENENYNAPLEWGEMGYVVGAGDAHVYPHVPHRPETERLIRTLGHGGKPVFLSEYGIGSLMNVIGEAHAYDQHGIPVDTEEFVLLRLMAKRFLADWERFGFDGVYPFPEDMLIHSQRLHCRQRTIGFNLVRSNPQIAGFNLTGMLDHAMTGEGAWTFWREWKPGIADCLRDGWAPLRWCLFTTPMHCYSGSNVRIEAVLANENVLPPGEYPVRLRVFGPGGIAWEHAGALTIPAAEPGADPPLAVPVFDGEVNLSGPAGEYVLAAELERGGAAAGGRLRFHVADWAALPRVECRAATWGLEPRVLEWLEEHGVQCEPFREDGSSRLILVGDLSSVGTTPKDWENLWQAVKGGGAAVFLSPGAFRRDGNPAGWLPPEIGGKFTEFNDWLYHKECVARRHPVFEGLAGPGILHWNYYGPVISSTLFEPERTPDEVIAAAFALGYPCPGGYASGIMIGAYRLGKGAVLINTLHILENATTHPAADRLMLNLVRFAAFPPVGRG